MNEETRNSVEIELRPMLMTLWRKKTQILAAALVCGLLAFLISFFLITPQYASSAMFYVNNSAALSDSISSGDLSASRSLVDAYVIILNTVPTLEEIAEQAGVDRTCGELESMISAFAVNDTQILKVAVTGGDPAEVYRIADAVAEVLPRRISEIIDGASTRIVDVPRLPTEPCDPDPVKHAMIGFAAGCLLMAAVLLRCVWDGLKASEKAGP